MILSKQSIAYTSITPDMPLCEDQHWQINLCICSLLIMGHGNNEFETALYL